LSDPRPNPALDQRLDPVIAEYLEAVERGGNTDPKHWLERYPELASELRDFFATEARFDRLVAPLRSGSPFLPTLPGTSATVPIAVRNIKDYELL